MTVEKPNSNYMLITHLHSRSNALCVGEVELEIGDVHREVSDKKIGRLHLECSFPAREKRDPMGSPGFLEPRHAPIMRGRIWN